MYKKIRGGIVYKAYTACHDCGAPQAICRRYVERRSGGFMRVAG